MPEFNWKEFWYSFVVISVAFFNVVIDNYLLIILILLVCVGVRMVWKVR